MCDCPIKDYKSTETKVCSRKPLKSPRPSGHCRADRGQIGVSLIWNWDFENTLWKWDFVNISCRPMKLTLESPIYLWFEIGISDSWNRDFGFDSIEIWILGFKDPLLHTPTSGHSSCQISTKKVHHWDQKRVFWILLRDRSLFMTGGVGDGGMEFRDSCPPPWFLRPPGTN